MKKTALLIWTILMAGSIIAQSPQAFKYQAVVRDNAGNIVNNQLAALRISIIQGSTTGTSVYSETHQPTTNDFGLANLEIGTGSIVSGTFASIDWSTGSYFLKVELDATGGTTYELMGTSQLLSVPYALHSGTTSNPDDGDWTISGDDLYSTVDGNVGIGTTTPGAKLDVSGHIAISNTGNSVFIGEGAGENDDLTENFNLFIGNNAGNINTSGWGNIALGNNSLSSNTTGPINLGLGAYSLEDNSTGTGNIALGYAALLHNTTGEENLSIGLYANWRNETGNYNTAVGHYTLEKNKTGSYNTAIGYKAGYNWAGIANDGGVFVGYEAGKYEDNSNKLYIENSSSSGPLIYGEFDNDILAVNGILGVGTMTPSATLEVAGHIAVSNTGNSVFIGEGAGTIDDLSDNNNSFIGYNSGNFNTTGEYNTAIGSSTLEFNSGGSYNTAVGFEALASNGYGDNNTAIGYQSGHVVTNAATGCVYIGYQAGWGNYHDDELFIENSSSTSPLIWGDFSDDILTVNGKLGIGTENPEVKLHVTGGTDVTLAGGGSFLAGLTTGENIAMDENEIMARNNGAISSLHLQRNGGALMVHYELEEINEFMINTAGRTGIGETTPTAKLHINTSTGEDGVRVQVGGATNFKVHSNGGIANYNVTTPTFALQLENSALDLQGRGKAWSWNLWSDSRVKSKQRTIEYGLKEVMQLTPKSYDHHSSSTSEEGEFIMVTDHKTPSIGFIAQEVQKIIPEAVSEPLDDSKDLWSMDYDKLIPVLTKAIQEQQDLIVKLNTENTEFRKRIEALESR